MKVDTYRIAAIMTCHNRKESTVMCIKSLINGENNNIIVVYMVDDGCNDGTAETVKHLFPEVNIIKGSGALFWNRGMYLGFKQAVSDKYDFYLWINDDVVLYPKAVDKLINAYIYKSESKSDIIITGPLMNTENKINTYGGFGPVKSFKPYEVKRIYLNNEYQKCLIFHGNCVLIPQAVVDKIGLNDPYYQHGYGDVDYSLRAAKSGCECWLPNFAVGTCERHDESFCFLKNNLPIRVRLKNLHSRINHPYRDELYFVRKFYGIWWPYKFVSADIKIIVSSLNYKLKALLKVKKC